MTMTITPAAAERIKSFLASRGKGLGLRIGLKTSGCSGMAYILEFVDELNDDDELYAIDGVNIIIDAKSLVYLQGIELDFVKEGLNEGFEFNNPNAKGECGCGESFTV
ncbi:iron-sulfur cluster assembly protein IscA [uncultured Shewanella sp.]|uniref:iron-sulfur cluster assembly protein IscA n=1 Tax=uncultured Shewanella sp. TaxID=173975 RepID=UPI002623C3EA|nr:iron-sulfur cluster assembly protein IscA [uncultured Shewanella sp.]